MLETPTIFLCYTREDKDIVDAIYLTMKKWGLNPWMDKPPKPYNLEGIRPGEDWNDRIRTQIRNSAYFVACLSKRSVEKRGYVQREYRLALSMRAEVPPGQIFLIPVLLEKCTLPKTVVDDLSFASFQWLDLETEGTESLIQFLRKDIADRQRGYGASPTVTTQPETPQEFADSIASNVVIQLKDKEYCLHSIKNGYYPNIYFEPVHDGDNIVIRNIDNIHIRGAGNWATRLLVSPRYSNTLSFENCNNISLSNLVLGHGPELGYCLGGVVRLENCSNVTITQCDMFGSGTEGLTVRRVTGLRVAKSVIRDCTYGILSIEDSSDIELSECVFRSNKEFYGLGIYKSTGVRFIKCQMIDNVAEAGSLIAVGSSAGVLLTDSELAGNRAKRLSTSPERVEIINCSLTDNDFFGDPDDAESDVDPYVGIRLWNVIRMAPRPE